MIHIAEKKDAKEILEIYRPFVEDTAVSFEEVLPKVEEMERRIETTLTKFPYLVFKSDGKTAAYAYAGAHKERASYRWSVDSTIYVAENARGKGVGRRLYSILFEILKELGYYNVFAGITIPNDGSIGIHEKMGFKRIARYEKVGYKFGNWHDVGWWQLDLGSDRDKPDEPVNFQDYIKRRGSKVWE